MKPYVKPQLFIESYELSQHVAACGWDMNQADKYSCAAVGDEDFGNSSEVRLFNTDDNAACNMNDIRYCYMNATVTDEGKKLFNS